MPESITITVAGVDRTEYLCQPDSGQALEFSEALRERKTVNCEFLRRSGSWIPARGQHVALAHSVEGALFGGYITSVRKRKEGGANAGGLKFVCTVVSYEQVLDRRRAAAYTYIDTALEDIFTQLMDDSLIDEGFTVVIDDAGPVIPKFEIQSPRPSVREAAEALCALASNGPDIYYYRIDPDKSIHLFKQDTTPAPFSITDATPYILADEYGEVEESNDGKVNRVFGFAGQYLQPAVTESFVGDGASRTFELDNPCGATPSIKVNGVEVGDFIGVDGQTGFQWYWSQNSRTIRQDDAGTLLTGSDTLDVTYQPLDRLEIGPVEDAADASAEGVLQGDGTGIFEDMLTLETPHTQSDAETVLAAHLARNKRATVTFRGAMYTSGLRAGQELSIDLTTLEIDLSMLILSVTMMDRGGGRFLWSFTAIFGAAREDWKRGFLGKSSSGSVVSGSGASGGGTALSASVEGWVTATPDGSNEVTLDVAVARNFVLVVDGAAVTVLAPVLAGGGAIPPGSRLRLYLQQDGAGHDPPAYTLGAGAFANDERRTQMDGRDTLRTMHEWLYDGTIWCLDRIELGIATS
jgi:hypothetical protein